MAILRNVFEGSKILGVAVVSFLAGAIGWAILTGFIGGFLDSLGVVIAGSTYLAFSPVAGFAAAGYAVREVTS